MLTTSIISGLKKLVPDKLSKMKGQGKAETFP